MGFGSVLKKTLAIAAVAVAVAAIAIVAVPAAIATTSTLVAIGLTVLVAGAVLTGAEAVDEIIATDNIDQYLEDSGEGFVKGNWSDKRTALSRLGNFTLWALIAPSLVATCGRRYSYIKKFENTC